MIKHTSWEIKMREPIIAKLKQFIADSDGYGIPRYFDCNDEDAIKDPAELDLMGDDELVEVFEACVGVGG